MVSLSPPALSIINTYLALPFKTGPVPTPYYNNERLKLHAGLRALIGKGSPQDIMEEALIISLHNKINLDVMPPEAIKKFLVDNRLGVDCSALVYYALNAELKNRGRGSLGRALHFPLIKNPLRKLLAVLRPAENTNVATLAHPANSTAVPLQQCRAGDLIILKNTGPARSLQHILLVHSVDQVDGQIQTLHYTHSFAWKAEGKYDHGVRQGTILITNPNGNLLDQTWNEKNQTGDNNETYAHAKMAESLDLRRLKKLV